MEIGSEYSWEETEKGTGIDDLFEGSDRSYVFSGRTAIETALRNLRGAKKALLPSYCCESMIDPFLQAGIEIVFYPVYFAEGLQIELEIPDDADVLLWCDYFGFHVDFPDVASFISRGGVVIEDITQNLLSENTYNFQSRYLVASLRKWFPVICGGICIDLQGTLLDKPDLYPANEFILRKKNAMLLKKRYLYEMSKSYEKKDEFLREFSWSNKWLEKNYSKTTIDRESLYYVRHADIEKQRKIRKRNANVLYSFIEDSDLIRPLFQKSRMDCPFFVPVWVCNGKRQELKTKLIEDGIFCPCHWSRPNATCDSNLYDNELSLVCDQRYSEEDMKRIGTCLTE